MLININCICLYLFIKLFSLFAYIGGANIKVYTIYTIKYKTTII